jgi:hypothetical protein
LFGHGLSLTIVEFSNKKSNCKRQRMFHKVA